MKKAITIAAAVLLGISAWGQQSLRDVIAVITGSGAVCCDYSYTARGDVPVTGKGTAVVSGEKFRQSDGKLETWCDGTSTWAVDRSSKEVVITGGGNPILSHLEEYESIIHISSFDGQTLICSIVSEAQGLDIEFKAENITSLSGAEAGAFSFDTSALGQDWIITDLR